MKISSKTSPRPSRKALLGRAFAIAALASAAACGAPQPAAPAPAPTAAPAPAAAPDPEAANIAMTALASKFLGEYLRLFPVRATEAGDHRYDAQMPDMSEAGDDAVRKLIAETREELAKIPREDLSEQNRIDAAILEGQLNYWVFSLIELREAEQNPIGYTGAIGDGIDPLVNREFAPVGERMKSVLGRLKAVPTIVAVAKTRLTKPPRVHTETAIQQNLGLIAFVETDLAPHFAKVPEMKDELTAAAKEAGEALRDFQKFLETDLLPRSDGSFRLGRARFEKKLRFALEDDVDIDAVLSGAKELLKKTQEEMVETAVAVRKEAKKPVPKLDTTAQKLAFVKAVLGEVAAERPTNKTIVSDAKKLLDEATAFVREKDLVRLPDEPCEVIEMPEYRRGVAVAYCDSSGPLEAKPETFYAIAPTPKDWSRKRAESFYREYNRSMLAELTIHEAMPGHFLQLMHGNKYKSDVRAVFSSGPFVEGWAVYSEWLMAKYGFGGPKVRLSRQKMVLRLAANAILDHEIHAGNMEEKEALALMTQEAFQEEGEAIGKWRRARLTSAQLTTYYYGFTEMMKLRAEAEAREGFSERAYHDKLLSSGSPAMRHIRTLMTPKP